MKVKNIVFTALFSVFIVLCSFTTLEKPFKVYNKIDIVVIDAGHGGKDPGCKGAISKEADVALKVAKEVGATIKKYMPEVKVIYTRDTNKFIELHDRAAIANKNKADIFISIHCNSGPSAAFGTETFIMGLHKARGNLEVAKRENEVILMEDNHSENYDGYDPNGDEAVNEIIMSNVQYAFQEQSQKFATNVEDQFKNRVKRKSRGVKQAGLLVLWKTAMPSVLIELGFLTNKTEEKYLNDELGRSYMASAIYRAFRDYKNEYEKNNK